MKTKLECWLAQNMAMKKSQKCFHSSYNMFVRVHKHTTNYEFQIVMVMGNGKTFSTRTKKKETTQAIHYKKSIGETMTYLLKMMKLFLDTGLNA